MEIQSGIDGLKTLLGVTQAASSPMPAGKGGASAGGGSTTEVSGDRATLSEGAIQVARTASEPDVRMDRVAAVQAALAAGSYEVPASAVATKVINAMLGAGR